MNSFFSRWRAQRKSMRYLERLAREQGGVAAFSMDEFMATTSTLMSDDEWDAWQAAMREARGHD